MDPGSFFLLFVVTVAVIGAGIALVVARMFAGAGRGDQTDAPRPVHHQVTTPYHEHTDMTSMGSEPDRASSSTEHQAE